jgi:Ras GTPase-activating-like protein IQGAP2/3
VVITKILSEFLEKDESLEINPLKVYDWMIIDYETKTGKLTTLNRKPSGEEAAANADVQAIIAPRIQTLGEISDHVISTLIASVKTVPYGIRWICKQIFNLAQVLCGHQLTIVASFLFSVSVSVLFSLLLATI